MPAKAAWFLCLLVAVPLPSRGQIQVLNVTSSADFTAGLFKPGGLVSIFCTGIEDVPGLVTAQGYPLPGTLAGVKVTVNGTVAPILAVANLAGGTYQQINIQIPWEVTTTSGLAFDVSQQDAPPSHFFTWARSPWPVFFVDSSGYAVAQHADDYRPVTPGDAARPGEWIVVYATNLGSVHNQPPDGYPADAHDLSPIVTDSSPYLYYFGLAVGSAGDYRSTRIQSNYIGLVPGSVVYQVNLLVPSSQPAGELVFQLVGIYDCGFFFVLGCGRGFTTVAESLPAKVPVAN